MMKKLMILSLVLAVSAMSSAAFVVTAPNVVMLGESFEIILGGSAPAFNLEGGLYGSGAPKVLAADPLAGALTGASRYIEEGFDGWEFFVGDSTAAGQLAVPAGVWVRFNAVADELGDYTFDLYDYSVSYDAPAQSFVVSVIPEPMTMGLLGLGALFLRRRK